MPEPKFFATPAAWRAWLAKNHDKTSELLVGFYKKGSGKPSITWPESVDEALCYGWIDGVRKSLGEAAYTIRFTPRRPTSNWSAVNVRRVGVLTKEGRMTPAGLAAFAARKAGKTATYGYEQSHTPKLPRALESKFRAKANAWGFFSEQPPGYRRSCLRWIAGAKKEETRERRLAILIKLSARGERLDFMKPQREI